jgi:hypothetical protein
MIKWKDFEGNGPGLIKVVSQNLAGSTKNITKTSAWAAGVRSEIRTELLPHVKLERLPPE